MSGLILASASQVRARLLNAAGVPFEVRTAGIDEDEVRASLQGEGADAIADALAELKAVRVSQARPDALVIGCDQVLAFEGRLIAKSPDVNSARTLLSELRGKTHTLLTACVLAKGGAPIWRRLDRPALAMRPFDDEFLDAYLAAEGTDILNAVGCYYYEGRGAQLFERVEGDYFSVLGLPLLPLLAVLRDHGILK